MLDSIVGDSKMASVRKVSQRNEPDIYVAQRKEGFSVLLRVDVGRWRSRAQAERM
jgi:hypothetical protein